jgi:hypothetical protein
VHEDPDRGQDDGHRPGEDQGQPQPYRQAVRV